MRFRVLGPLEVSDNGRQIDLPGGKQRALLCTLLLDANRVVSVDRLIDALWDEAPPETAVKALQVHVSQLRKAIGNRVHRRGGGYLVAVDSHELDLLEFTDLVASGDYRAALRLWRGSPLPELGGAHFAAGEIARLEELRVNCVERRIEAELAAGHGAELVGELESLVHLHPLRERLRGQLMLALYRSGRQADALEAFQAARTALVDELGLEPGRELRDLHQRILNQDVDLDAAAAPAEVSEKTTRKEEHEPAVTATRETRKMVTVLCAAIEAAGAGEARLDPEALRHMVGRVTDEIRSAVGRYEGTVVSEAGDAVTGIFGIPTAHEDDAVRAIRAAAEIAAAAGTLASELADTRNVVLTVGLGVGTGEVVVGGDLQPAGEPLSAAMRLARRSSTGDVLLDEQTHRLARGDVAASAATGAYVLVDATPVTPGRIGGRRSAMVGRERELRRLGDALAQAVADRSCQLFTILGAAGVGKSRLVDELLGRIDDARVCRGRCLPYGEGITYWPVLEIVRDAVGIEDGDSPDDALERLTSSLGETDDPQRLARNLAELIGLSDGVLAAEDARTAVRVLIETIARDRPAIVVFDDIHWGESAFLDLVEHLAEWTRDSPTLLLCLARPELLDVRPSWGGGKLNATSILLQPLSDDESARLIDILDGVALDGETRNRIIAGAGGNPLFVEEMLALALEDEHGSELSVPPTIQALLAARLDRLGETERLALECAAVGGKVFYEEAVVELAAPLSAEQVEAALGTLMRKELIRLDRTSVGGRTYGFRHMLIRDAAYDAIPKHARADLHERFGRWLEQMASDRLAEYEEVVGYHLEQASLFLRQLGVADAHAHELARAAATRLGTAGRRAFIRSDAPAGVNLVSRAVALLPPEDPQRVELVPNVRVIQGLGVDFAFADRVLTEAVEAAATTGDRRLAANALVQRAFLRLFTEADVTADELLETARRAADVFEHLDDNLGLARAWRLIGQAHYLARRGHECAEASERAFAYARLAHDVFEQREILEWLAIAFFLGPIHAEEGVRRCEQLRELARGDAIAEVHILGAEAFLLGMLGRTDEALALLARGEELQAELGEWIWIYTWHSAAIHLWAGNAALAEAELRPPYEALKKLGERSHFSTMTHGLAMATYMQGRYDEAEELTRECEAAARANDVFSEIMWRAVRAKVFARTGRLDAAAMLATEAVALAKSGDFHVGTAEALMDLAEVEGLAGRPDNAAAAIEDALRYCALKGNLLAAERARTQLLGLQTAGFTGS